MFNDFNRRDFIRIGALAGAGLALEGISKKTSAKQLTCPAPAQTAAPALEVVRVGIIGVGGRGTGHVENLLGIDNVEIRAVCDVVPDRVANVQKMVQDKGQPKPKGYTDGDYDFRRLCEQEDLDIIYIASPWLWHVPMCKTALLNGKHAACEVPLSVSSEGCWELVEVSEKTGKYCIMLENCCYGESELLALNMIRKGVFGEMVHGACGYLHDLRGIKFSGEHEGTWRLEHSIERNGNLYPTHGLGPIAECADINRGDQFDFLVSMSSKSVGLNAYAAEHFGEMDPRTTQPYALGDVNTSIIRTKNDITITLVHDCNLPRPYSRINLVQGSKGLMRSYPEQTVYVEGRSEPHKWDPMSKYQPEFQHKLWKEMGNDARERGHGGMDYIMNWRLIDSLRNGRYPDFDVYDGAAWSVVSELSERSVANRSKPVDFPDFTRGAWKTNQRIFLTDI